MNILAIGDVVGSVGCKFLRKHLPSLKKIKQIDKSRAQNHSFISSTSWGNIHGYDLCINTSNLDIKSIIPQIAAFAEYWFSTHNEAEK